MDQEILNQVNDALVMIFNEILSIEEDALCRSQFSDLSVKEMHTIEAIGLKGDKKANQVAKKLNITPGTLSVSIQNLVKKGYVTKVRLAEDRRVTRLQLTKSGKLIYRLHRKFHMQMVRETLSGMTDSETKVLMSALDNLHHFLLEVKEETKHLDN